jgi:hypothetical protein
MRKVSEVVAILSDKGFCEPHVVEKKGMGGSMQSYVEWHEVVRMLDEAFGPFGWDAVPTSSFTDIPNGVFIYDGYIVGRAIDDETGAVVELKRAGRGMGLVPESARNSASEIDRQGHGAKSDFYSNASKALGAGFGLYLYGSKVRNAPAGSQQTETRQASTPTANKAPAGGPRPSEKQMTYLLKHYTQGTVDGMDFKTWKSCLDAIFGKQDLPVPSDIATANKVAPVKAPAPKPVKAAKNEELETVDDMPW